VRVRGRRVAQKPTQGGTGGLIQMEGLKMGK